MREIVEDIFARRDVDLNVAPLLGWNLGEPPLHQRLAGRDDLDDGRMAGFEIALDRGDQRRRLHRRDEMIEEALLGALEGRARGGLGLGVQRAAGARDVGGLEGGVEIVVDDAERARIGVVDAALLRREPVFDELVRDAFVGERARGVEPERLEIAGEHLHGGDAAGLDRLDELGARRERKIRPAPQAEPLRIGEIVDRGGARRRDIEHAGVGKRVLEPQAGAALLRRLLIAALAFAAAGVLHGVALVEHDHAVEVAAEPVDDLLHARGLRLALGRAQGRVGGEEDALGRGGSPCLAQSGPAA